MAGTYGEAVRLAFIGQLNWTGDTLQGMLCQSTYGFDKEETSMTPAAVHRATGTTDAALTAVAPSKSAGVLTLDISTNPVFPSVPAGQNLNAIIVYKFDTNDAQSTPASYNDFTPIDTNNSDVTVTFNVLGAISASY